MHTVPPPSKHVIDTIEQLLQGSSLQMPKSPEACTAISIPTSQHGWMDIRIVPKDPEVKIIIDNPGASVSRFTVNKEDLMKVLNEIALEKLAK